MLQYFMPHKYKHILNRDCTPKLEYFCKVDEVSSVMPRAMHVHENLVEVLLVYKGSGIYTIDNNKYIAKKGDLIFYNSGVVHDEFGGNGSNLGTYCLGISNLKIVKLGNNKIIEDNYCPIINCNEYFDDILSMFDIIRKSIDVDGIHVAEFSNFLVQALVVKFRIIIEKNGDVKQIKESMFDIIRKSIDVDGIHVAEFSNFLVQALVVKFRIIIEKNGDVKQIKEPSLATKVKIYIDKNYNENISLKSIAEAVNANQYYLSHIFKEETGFSPMQYVTRRRIGEAQNLLINTQLSITEIAANVGYNNSNYFQNVFKKIVGYTPGSYRKRWQV